MILAHAFWFLTKSRLWPQFKALGARKTVALYLISGGIEMNKDETPERTLKTQGSATKGTMRIAGTDLGD